MMQRREVVLAGVAAGAALYMDRAAAATSPAGPLPRVTGPVTGGRRGTIFGAYFGDIAKVGYIEEEYFVEGTAERFEPVGAMNADGKWTLRPAGTAPFATRVMIRRPVDRKRFNGTVVCEWANVSGGYEISFANPRGLYDDGFAYASISAQFVGVNGLRGQHVALREWDPERYGSLSIPGDSYSYDIFTQVARALTAAGRVGADPMGGFVPRHLVAIGGSQSAARLLTYTNAIQPRARVFSAIVLVTGAGAATGFDDSVYDPRVPPSPTQFRRVPSRVRDDLGVPVMYVNSEHEALAYFGSRQPDTAKFRYWEIAGASHATLGGVTRLNRVLARDGDSQVPLPGHPSEVDWLPTVDAAVHHVHRWLNGGPPPPRQQPIEIDAAGTAIVRDAFGNAKGGVRLPEVEVPVARYDGHNPLMIGTTEPFSAKRLKTLYPTRADYVAKVERAARAAEAAGVILPYRVDEYVAQAQSAALS